MQFYDGAANCDSESEIDMLIAAVRDDAFALAAEAAQRVRDFDAPCNMTRQRVCLDFAKRAGVDPAKIEEDRQTLEAARLQAEASGHVLFDPAHFFRELRKRGCNPIVIGRGHDVGIAHAVGPGSKPGELFGEAMESDTDGDLRFDYARSVWAARTPGAFDMPLGV